MIKNKKILLMCKETYSYPLYFLANLLSDNNTVAAFFFMAPECVYNKTGLNNTTYYKFLENPNISKVYTIEKEAQYFNDILYSSKIIDYDYLMKIEKKYTKFNNLNLQLMSSQFTTNHYHFRNYYKDFNYWQSCNWLILNYKCVESIFDDFHPDLILDLDDAELPRQIVNEIAHDRSIDYITIDHPRFEFYKLATTSLAKLPIQNFVETYRQVYNDNTLFLSEEFSYIKDYHEKASIMPKEYSNTITSKYEPDSLFNIIKHLYGNLYYFFEQDFIAKNLKIKQKNKYIYPSSLEYMKYYIRVEFTRRKLLKKNKYFDVPELSEKYVYMPLHLIPESTTFVKAPFYVDELSIIEAVSKSLPIDWKLYVKEHQAMLGERSKSFYKHVKELHNVKLISLNYYKDPKPLIVNSMGVVTITGTSAFEAALLNKPSVIFGDTPFNVINSVCRIDSFEKLPELLKSFNDFKVDERSCAAYLHVIKKFGEEVKLKFLMSEGEKIIRGKTLYSDEYEKELKQLIKLYEKTIN